MRLGIYFIYCQQSSSPGRPVFRYLSQTASPRGDLPSRFPVYLIIERENVHFAYYNLQACENDGRGKMVKSKIITLPLTAYEKNDDSLSVALKKEALSSEGWYQYFDQTVSGTGGHVAAPKYNALNLEKFCNRKAILGEGALPQLILDFFYDLYNTNVFDMSKDADHLREVFKSHFFTKSIYRKFDFLYKSSLIKETTLGDGVPSLYFLQYLEAEEKWIDCLEDNNSYHLFKTEWFGPSVEEVKSIRKEHLLRLKFNGKKEREMYFDNKEKISKLLKERFNYFNEPGTVKRPWYRFQGYAYGIGVACLLVATIFCKGWLISKALIGLSCMFLLLSFLIPFLFIKAARLFRPKRYFGKIIDASNMFQSLAMLTGIILAWCAYIPIIEESWTVTLYLDNSLWPLAFMVLFWILIHFSIKYKIPEYREKGFSAYNSLFILCKGYCIALAIGVIVMSVNKEKLIFEEPEKYLPHRPLTLSGISQVEEYKFVEKNAFDFLNKLDSASHSKSAPLIPGQSYTTFKSVLGPERARLEEITSKAVKIRLPFAKYVQQVRDFCAENLARRRQLIENTVAKLGDELGEESNIPFIAAIGWTDHWWFIYPRLLMMYSFMTFFIGYLLDFFLDLRSRKTEGGF